MPRVAPLVQGTSPIITSAIVVIATPAIITPASITSFSVIGTKPSSASNTSPHVKTSSIYEWTLQNYFTVNFVFLSHILDLGTEVVTKEQRRKLAFFAKTLNVFW